MAVALDTSYTTSDGFSGNLVIDKPAGVVSGNLLLIHISSGNLTGFTPPAGWTVLRENTTNVASHLYYRVADGLEGSTFTFARGGNGNTIATCIRVHGNRTATPIGASSIRANAASTTATGDTITPDTSESLILFFVTSDNNPTISGYTNVTAPPAYSELYELDNADDPTQSLAYANRTVASALGSCTATLSGSNANTVTMVAIPPTGFSIPIGALPATATLGVWALTLTQSFAPAVFAAPATLPAFTITNAPSTWTFDDKDSTSWTFTPK